jgi:cob(I)alamin adenosyltransferase
MKVYTRTGDGGETSLFSGGRVGKDHHRLEAYGTLDELNSVLGVLRAEPLPDDVDDQLASVQETLFEIGSALADPELRIDHDHRAWDASPLELWIDAMDERLEPLSHFILPGGSRGAGLAHVARTVCRRAERRVVAVEGVGEMVPDGVGRYLNRLSDALFVAARFLNAGVGVSDPVWAPRRRETE